MLIREVTRWTAGARAVPNLVSPDRDPWSRVRQARPIKRMPVFVRAACATVFIIIILAHATLCFGATSSAPADRQVKRVLALYAFDREEDFYVPLDEAFRSHLISQVPNRLEFYTEYLELARFSDPKHAQTLVEMLRQKFSDKRPDLIVVSHAALLFLLGTREDFFRGIPIVTFFDESNAKEVAAIQELSSKPEITGVITKENPKLTLDLALRVQPDTKNVVVVIGSSWTERSWLAELQRNLSGYAPGIAVSYLTGLTMAEVRKQLAVVPPHTIIFFSSLYQDSAGQSFGADEEVDLIASAARAPVYGRYLPELDHGFFGGYMSDPAQVGTALAGITARVLSGERPTAIPMVVDSSAGPTVDWRQLHRWGIDEKRVPAGTRILHREPSPWERYRNYITIAISLFLVEALLIVVLFLERMRRRRAETRLLNEKTFIDALIEAMPGALNVLDENLNAVRWNRSLEKIARFQIGSGALVNVAEGSKDLARQTLRKLAVGGTAEAEIEVLSKGEKTLPFYYNVRRVKLGDKTYFIAAGIDISERKQAEEQLRLSEQRFSSAFEHAPIGIALTAPDGRYIKVNRALCDMLGYTADELQRKTWQEITYPDDIEADWNRSCQILEGKSSAYQMREKRYLSKSGNIVWASVSVSLVRNNMRQPEYFIVQALDITERKRIEGAVRGIVEGIRVETGTDFFSSMALQLCKATDADHTLIGKFINDGEPAVSSLGMCINRTIAENITYKLTGTPCDGVRNKGACSYLSGLADLFPDHVMLRELRGQAYVGVPLLDSQRRVVGVMFTMFSAPLADSRFVESVLQVFSKWTAAEIERSQAEERFSKAFQSSPEGCAIATLQGGQFIDCNDAFLQMMGYSRSEVIGNTAAALRVWIDPEERSALIKKLAEGGRAREEAVKFRTKSGKVLDIRMSAEVIYLQNEACLLGLARDVTEQNALEEQFRQAQKMEALGRLAGGMAHDFNNLLGVVIGYSELLLATGSPNAPAIKKIEAIKHAAQRAASLTARLLAYSRRQPTQPRILKLNSVVAENESMLRQLVGEDIKLVTIQDPNLGHVRADANQLVQVVMNLAINARDAMSGRGTLTIEIANVSMGADSSSLVQPGDYVKLALSDTGTGMDEATRARIFEPFFTTKPPGQGTGLGLATVYSIVEQNGGAILVDTRLGVGTTFEIYLPRTDQPATPEVELAPGKEIPGSATVLLVEDEVALRIVIDEMLRHEGYRVMAVGNGLDALRIAERHEGPIHLLITDVIMPAMSGPELAQALAVTRPDTRVLFISGYTADRLAHYPKLDSDVSLLRKPFKLNDLAHKVHDLLSQGSQAQPQRTG